MNPVSQPISPELVLVCPELRELGLATLANPVEPLLVPVWPAALAYAGAAAARLAVRAVIWVVVVALAVTVPLLL